MSTIPTGLRADFMRKRIVDKATIKNIGSLYVGSGTNMDYGDVQGREINELPPGSAGQILYSTSNGIEYHTLTTNDFPDRTIGWNKLGSGAIFSNSLYAPFYFAVVSEGTGIGIATRLTAGLPSYTLKEDTITYIQTINSTDYSLPLKFNDGNEVKNYYVVDFYNNANNNLTSRCVWNVPLKLEHVDESVVFERTSSPYKNASLQTISEQDKIYFNDTIRVTVARSIDHDLYCVINCGSSSETSFVAPKKDTSAPASTVYNYTVSGTGLAGLANLSYGQYYAEGLNLTDVGSTLSAGDSIIVTRTYCDLGSTYEGNLASGDYIYVGDVYGWHIETGYTSKCDCQYDMKGQGTSTRHIVHMNEEFSQDGYRVFLQDWGLNIGQFWPNRIEYKFEQLTDVNGQVEGTAVMYVNTGSSGEPSHFTVSIHATSSSFNPRFVGAVEETSQMAGKGIRGLAATEITTTPHSFKFYPNTTLGVGTKIYLYFAQSQNEPVYYMTLNISRIEHYTN